MYLILHKVRGEPAFDVASPMEVDGERWWIIPTSGHRAYPYANWPLSSILPAGAIDQENLQWAIPQDWPDHYQVSGEKPPANFNIMNIVSNLMPKIRRRV